MKHIYPGNFLGGSALYLGLSLGDILYYDSVGADTFDKGEFPGLRAIICECQGGGGAGGGAEVTGASEWSGGAGGCAGHYARSLILATDLAESEAVTVGAGGNGVTNANGGTGGDSIFDTISGEVRGTGGVGGNVGVNLPRTAAISAAPGLSDPVGSVGDIIIPGNSGGWGFLRSGSAGNGGSGGGAVLGGGSRGTTSQNTNGFEMTTGYGSGGTGGGNSASQGTARAGGDGRQGIVIVGLLY